MSVIADVREALQDLVTPEFKALVVRVEAIEKRFDSIDKRFDAVDKRFDAVEKKMESNKQEVLSAIHGLADYNSLSVRVAKIETKQESAHQ